MVGFSARSVTSGAGPIGSSSYRRTGSSSRTFAKDILRTSPGSRRCATTPTTSTVPAVTARRGSAALVNTVGESRFWNSTAIFMQWDDWGGLYDHVPPPKPTIATASASGFRWSSCRHTPNRLRFARAVRDRERAAFRRGPFGLDQLAQADKRANSPAADCFDFSQSPRPFVQIDCAAAAEVLHA